MKSKNILSIKVLFLLIVILFQQKTYSQVAGNALQFDGVNDFVNIGNANLNLNHSLAVMAWIKWDVDPSTGNNFATIISNNSSQSQNDGQFYISHNNNNSFFEFGISTNGGKKSVTSKTSPAKGIWYNIAGIYDNSKIIIYVNGIPEDSVALTGNIIPFSNNMNLTIGESAKNANNYRRFKGIIDNVTVWNKAFTKLEIQSMFNLAFTGNEPGLVAYWNMNEPSGTTVYDLSLNSLKGINTGIADIVSSSAPITGTLPIELLYFNTKCKPDTSVEITWATSSETNNNYFTILKSTDLINWTEIGTTAGSGTSNTVEYYSFSDKKPETHDTYYKLSQTDFDGKSETFNLGSILCKFNHSRVTLFPNPVKDNLNLGFFNEHSVIVPVKTDIYNLNGNLIFSQIVTSIDGQNEFQFDVSEFKEGTYFIQITLGEKFLYSGKFIVQ